MSAPLLNAAARRSLPGYLIGRPPRNKGLAHGRRTGSDAAPTGPRAARPLARSPRRHRSKPPREAAAPGTHAADNLPAHGSRHVFRARDTCICTALAG